MHDKLTTNSLVDRQALHVYTYLSAVDLLRCSLGFSYDTPTIPISAGSALGLLILFTKTMNLSCFECVNEDSAMSSPSPPPRKPRADSPEDLIDVMPIPFYLCATSSEVNEDPDEASMSSQTFLEMLCYFYGDILSRVLGKRQQSDQKDETTPMPRSVSFLDTQTGISPLPSPGPPSRIWCTNITAPKDISNAPAIGKKAKKLKSAVSKVASSVKTKDPPSQAKDADEDLSYVFLSTITSGESVSPPMAASMPPPEASAALDDVDDKWLKEFLSMMVTPAPSEHEMRDDVSGGVYTTLDCRGDYPRPKRLDLDDMYEGMESLVLVPEGQTVPNAITKRPPPAAQHDLKPRGSLMNRFSHPTKKPIIISEQDVTDEDVLCGRDSRGSKHKGNVFYRDVVVKKRSIYKDFAKRQNKTDLSTFIIEDVIKGRFLTKHEGKHYRVFTWAESRKKVSQSLRENPRRKK